MKSARCVYAGSRRAGLTYGKIYEVIVRNMKSDFKIGDELI